MSHYDITHNIQQSKASFGEALEEHLGFRDRRWEDYILFRRLIQYHGKAKAAGMWHGSMLATRSGGTRHTVFGLDGLDQGICAMIPPLHTLFRVLPESSHGGSVLSFRLATLECLFVERGLEEGLPISRIDRRIYSWATGCIYIASTDHI